MQTLIIDERLPSLNEVIGANRTNKFAGASLKKRVENDIVICILTARLGKVEKPCELYITWQEENRKRDVDNVQSSQKFILDALVKGGILQNDSPRWVKQIHHNVIYGDTSCVRVDIVEEADES